MTRIGLSLLILVVPAVPTLSERPVVDEFGYQWHDYYEPENKRTKACYILPGAEPRSNTTLRETEESFFQRCDYGIMKELRDEMKYVFQYKEEEHAKTSWLACTNEHSILCHGKNVAFHFGEKIESPGVWPYWEHQIDLIHPVLSSDEETCDMRVNQTTIFTRPDSWHANFYHAMCDYANLYLSSHVLDWISFPDTNHSQQEISTFSDVVFWMDVPTFNTKFAPLYGPWTGKEHTTFTAKHYSGKRVCFDELVLGMNSRGSMLNFFYNMYVPGRLRPTKDPTTGQRRRGTYDISCSGSDLFVDFLNFLNHNNPVMTNTAHEHMTKSNRPIVVRVLSRSSGTGATSGTRKLLNENDVLETIREKYGEDQVDMSIVDFDWSQRHSIEKQVDAFQGCDVLFGMHGAGLANMLFMPRWASIIEAYDCDDSFCYSDLSRLSGFGYSRATEADMERFDPEVPVKESSKDNKKFFNYKIDVDVAVRLIEDAMRAVIKHKDSPFDTTSEAMKAILLLSQENVPNHSNIVKPYYLHDEF